MANLHAAFAQRWEDSAELSALLEVSKFATAEHWPDATTPMPFALGHIPRGRPGIHTSSGTIGRKCTFQVKIWDIDHSRGKQIADAVFDLFDNATWSIPGLTVVLARVDDPSEVQEEDGAWQFFMDVEVDYHVG